MTAPGSTFSRYALTLLRAPPSISYSTLRLSFTLALRAFVMRKKGECSGLPASARAAVRAHCAMPSAVTTARSTSPSSGSASANTCTPPNSAPTLPARMQLAGP